MAKMYLESNNSGFDILITDENGNWWYSEIDTNGFYATAEIYCDGEDETERVNKALENLRREIANGNIYDGEEWIEENSHNTEPVSSYAGKMGIDEIDSVVNYETNSFGDLVPIGHDTIIWYEV